MGGADRSSPQALLCLPVALGCHQGLGIRLHRKERWFGLSTQSEPRWCGDRGVQTRVADLPTVGSLRGRAVPRGKVAQSRLA